MTVQESYVLDAPDGSRPFDAVAIEEDLKNMWKRAGGDTGGAGDAGGAPRSGAIYRAALANLVVPLDPPLGQRLAPVLVDVTRRHPSRLFSIAAGAAPRGAKLRARTGAICHRRESGGGLVCSEQVVLDSDGDSAALIPSAIRSLLIGDLPMVLLDFHPGLGLPWIGELMDMADLVIVDSCLMEPGTEPAMWGFLEREGSRRVRDLAWARLIPWRAILAEVFDDKEHLPALRTIRAVELAFTGPAFPPAPVWLFAGWLASRLGWKTVGRDRSGGLTLRSETGAVALTMRGTGSGEGRVLEAVHIRAGEPHPLDVEISHEGMETSAHVTLRAPRSATLEVPFGYREFAACIVGEIHRHAANRPMEDAARAAEDMMKHWGKP
jgi:glucose-6-phosphate dehydrogenase assembly protein OpcA